MKTAQVSISSNEKPSESCNNGNMPVKTNSKTPRVEAPLMLHQWLSHKGMTAEELALAIDTSKSVISKLSNGKQRYNQDWLEKIAFVFKCDVPSLFHDPATPTLDEIYKSLSVEDKGRAIAILKTLLPK